MTETPWKLSRADYNVMVERAETDYPEETCGFLFRDATCTQVVPMENIQNRLHREDPKIYDRDARTAYCFDPLEMQRTLDEQEAAGRSLRGIYHSHPDHDAYFSETDSAAAAPFGGPSYPGTVYLVYSVRESNVVDLKAFDWSNAEEKYVEIAMQVDG